MAVAHAGPADEGLRLHESVIERIKELIASGEIAPGDRFPSERALEESLRVSRPVLREAFRVLESWGWIESRRGSGRYLRSPRGAPVAGPKNPLLTLERDALFDIWEARQILEMRTAALAAERATDDDLAQLRAALLVGEAATHDETARSNADLEFHLSLAAATHNFVLRDLVGFQVSLLKDMNQRRLLGRDSWRMLCRQHEAIAATIGAHDPARAAAAMESHMSDLKCAIFQIC